MAVDASYPRVRQHHQMLTRDALVGVFTDQQFAGRSLAARWDAVLASVLAARNMATASDIAGRVADALGGEFDPAVMTGWLTKHAELAAADINASTRENLEAATDDDGVGAVFAALIATKAAGYARTMVTTSANFAAHDAARAVGGASSSKTWLWSGLGPRHSELGGEMVPVESVFSNGMRWPGDPVGGAAEVANCKCSVSFG